MANIRHFSYKAYLVRCSCNTIVKNHRWNAKKHKPPSLLPAIFAA